MPIDTFTMKDGRKVKLDFTDIKSILAVKKKDMREIKQQLDDLIEIASSRMTGADVHRFFVKPRIKK